MVSGKNRWRVLETRTFSAISLHCCGRQIKCPNSKHYRSTVSLYVKSSVPNSKCMIHDSLVLFLIVMRIHDVYAMTTKSYTNQQNRIDSTENDNLMLPLSCLFIEETV